jgi:hypothetical protein
VAGRQGRRRKQLLDDLKEKRGHWKLKEGAPDGTVWRTCFGRICGPVVRQITVLATSHIPLTTRVTSGLKPSRDVGDEP